MSTYVSTPTAAKILGICPKSFIILAQEAGIKPYKPLKKKFLWSRAEVMELKRTKFKRFECFGSTQKPKAVAIYNDKNN